MLNKIPLEAWKAKLTTLLKPLDDRRLAWKAAHPVAYARLRLAGIAGGIAVSPLLLFLLLIRVGAFGDMPSRKELSAIQTPIASEVYDVEGKLLGKYYLENRTEIDFKELPEHLINALVSTEDSRFFRHNGIDWTAWARVFVKSILKGDRSSGGGSTISQQIAKNLFPRQEYRFASLVINKAREVMIARRLERMYTKEEVLELYLNTVPFSDNTFGILAASQRFFQKTPTKLLPEESATLVAMLKATYSYNPLTRPEQSLKRRNVVLALMREQGYLAPTLVDSLQKLPLKLNYKRIDHNDGLATYFREHLRRELDDIIRKGGVRKGRAYNIYTDGLKIYTTIDARLQKYAEESVVEHLLKLQKNFDNQLGKRDPWEIEDHVTIAPVDTTPEAITAAYKATLAANEAQREKARLAILKQVPLYRDLAKKGLSKEAIDSILNAPVEGVVVRQRDGSIAPQRMSPMDSLRHYLSYLNAGFLVSDHHSGAIKAWVGGIDYRFFKYDHVKSRRQPGSAFKPVIYAEALRIGLQPCDYFSNYLRTYKEYNNWQPRNSGGSYGGQYSMNGALSRSINTVSVEIIMRTTPDSAAVLARKLGMENKVPALPSIALGSVEANLLEMSSIYATFANGGLRPELHYVTKILDNQGEVIYQRPTSANQGVRVLPDTVAQVMVKMLANVVDNGTAGRLRYNYDLRGDLAGKTGTTQNHSDGWFMGLTPRLVGGVWVGGESPTVRFRDMSMGQGASTALPIWGIFLKKVYADSQYASWKEEKFPPLSKKLTAKFYCSAYRGEVETDSLDLEDELLDEEILEGGPPPTTPPPPVEGGNTNGQQQRE